MNCAVFALFCQLPLFFTCFQLRSTMKGLLPAKDFHPAKRGRIAHNPCLHSCTSQNGNYAHFFQSAASSMPSSSSSSSSARGGKGHTCPTFFGTPPEGQSCLCNNSQKLLLSRFHLDNYPKMSSRFYLESFGVGLRFWLRLGNTRRLAFNCGLSVKKLRRVSRWENSLLVNCNYQKLSPRFLSGKLWSGAEIQIFKNNLQTTDSNVNFAQHMNPS